MVPYLLLSLLALCGVQIGQAQTQKECYNCNFRMFNRCWFTNSYSSICADETYSCGNMRFLIGNYLDFGQLSEEKLAKIQGSDNVFTKSGCILASDCNKTAQVAGVLRMFNYNSTCCISNFCNGGFTAQAPHLFFLGTLSIFILYIIP